MKCFTESCDKAATYEGAWPGKGWVPYCEHCLNRAGYAARAMGFELQARLAPGALDEELAPASETIGSALARLSLGGVASAVFTKAVAVGMSEAEAWEASAQAAVVIARHQEEAAIQDTIKGAMRPEPDDGGDGDDKEENPNAC